MLAITLAALQLTASGQCASAIYAQKAFESGEAAGWSNYAEGPAARVQRQHPDTGLWAQAKFMPRSTNAGICQYYNHVGWVFTAVVLNVEKADVSGDSYWRREWIESSPDEDWPNEEQMDVCMEKRGQRAFPSVGCRFSRGE